MFFRLIPDRSIKSALNFCEKLLTKAVYSGRLKKQSTTVDKNRGGVIMKEIPKIHEGEYRFCLILWENEPISAAQLAKLCFAELGWKRTTSYTVLKRLCERGVLKNEDGVITSIISKDEAQACEIDELVEKRFSGSLPAFVAAFAKRRDMSERELDEVQRMIDSIRNGGGK